MNDTKNILLAWFSTTSTILAAFDTAAWISVISAIVLPILFFAIGKTVDVVLQIHFRNRDSQNKEK
jgi:hypothetical protein